MILDGYTFAELPDRWAPPVSKILNAKVETFGSIAYFSWGAQVIGQIVPLEWDKMSCDQWNRLYQSYLNDVTVEWDPEITKKLFHGPVTNGPFVVGKTITGDVSGATGTVIGVYDAEKYIEITPLTDVFEVGDTITDDSAVPKSADVTSFENVEPFDVRIWDMTGKYIEFAGPNVAAFRQNVRLELLIMAVA